MKIDLLITELDVGGAERCLTALSIYLKKLDHTVRVISLGPRPSANRDQLCLRIEEAKVPIEFLNACGPFDLLAVGRKLRKLIKISPPDIVQSFLFHANAIAAATYPQFSIPIVGGLRVAEQGSFRHRVNRWSIGKMKKVVSVSQSVASNAKLVSGMNPLQEVVIPNGIDFENLEQLRMKLAKRSGGNLTKYAQRQLGIPLDTPCLLFVGRMDKQKGVDALIQKADELLTALPNHQLILIGDGPLKTTLQSRASLHQSENRIHLVGHRDDVIGWMSSCDLLLLPTRYEGMPNVVIEAMANRLPVATTQAEGIADLLGEQASQQTVPVNDWEAWVRLVIQLANNQPLRASLTEKNLIRVKEHFKLEGQLRRYEATYAMVLHELSLKQPNR